MTSLTTIFCFRRVDPLYVKLSSVEFVSSPLNQLCRGEVEMRGDSTQQSCDSCCLVVQNLITRSLLLSDWKMNQTVPMC